MQLQTTSEADFEVVSDRSIMTDEERTHTAKAVSKMKKE